MNLKEIYSVSEVTKRSKPVISFEIFPDNNPNNIYEELNKLAIYKPSLISVTYGAGGSNRIFSSKIIKHLKEIMSFNVMPHLSCICNTKNDIEEQIKTIQTWKIENIMALRGDIPDDKTLCRNDFNFANELVEFVHNKTDLSIAVAGYPEGHIESPDIHTDIENLKRKVDAGASAIFTQLFYNNSKFFEYAKAVRKAGITLPVIAGIMPILSFKQIDKMTKLARIDIPKELNCHLDKFKDNSEDIKAFGIEFVSRQCKELLNTGVSGLHFFTLNKAYSTSKILENII